jgi:DNA-binding NtrC family response regulator
MGTTPPATKKVLLIVEDDLALRNSLRRQLRRSRIVFTAGRCDEARQILNGNQRIDSVLLDLNLPDGEGFDVARYASRLRPRPGVVVMTGDRALDNAVAAVRTGAVDFLLKPFDNDALEKALQKAETPGSLPAMRAVSENITLTLEQWRDQYAPRVIGQHPALLDVFRVLQRVSDTDVSVLITGESGTGKELFAQALHTAGKRQNAMVTVNCAAIPDNLLESQLFGHVRGSFTGADQDKIGHFTAADGGTIFLDEIGELPLALQAKILRVLQEKSVTPVGSSTARKVDVRVIAATNRDLEAMSHQGTFRLDLFYRLSVIPIELPSLRDRREDIPVLVRHFIERANRRRRRDVVDISQQALDRLVGYDWPGNIRQLENAIERMVILGDHGEIGVDGLPPELREAPAVVLGSAFEPVLPPEGLDLTALLARIENSLVLQALERTGWNKNQSARLLQMNRTTLVERLKKRGIVAPTDAPPSTRRRRRPTDV